MANETAIGGRTLRLGYPTVIGLAITLGVPLYADFVGEPLSRLLTGSVRLIHEIGSRLILDWVVVVVVIAVVLRLERLPLTSIGWRRLDRGDIKWAFLVWIVVMVPVVLLSGQEFAEEDAGQSVLALPVWFKLLLLPTVAVTEEILFRGYPVERLIALTDRPWLAGGATWIVFTAAHIPFFGLRTVLFSTAPGGLALTFLYVRRRSLPANVLLHFLLDLFVLLPASVGEA
ncbi:MAG: type II CAAX endopeptidase family protein [Actinomycetota bacterium]